MSEMLELGTLLREKREQKGLTVEQVSERIKLAPRTLAFIESGTKSELPHAVYVKGFVKSYATIVGLDPEELGAIVDVAYAEELAEDEGSESAMHERRKSGSLAKYIIAIIVVAAVAGGGYFAMQSGTSLVGGEEAVVEAPAKQPEAIVEPAPPVKEELPQQEAVQVKEEAVAEPVAEQAPVVEEPAQEPVVTEPAPEQAVVEKAEPVAATPVVVPPVVAPSDVIAQKPEKSAPAVEHALRIEATADCWVEATGEGFGRKEFLLRSGQSHTVMFPEKLSLRLGNSGGISLTLDGKPYVFDGKEGKVRTVHIAAS